MRAILFYNEEISMRLKNILIQEQKAWERLTDFNTVTGNASELFFEENDLGAFLLSVDKYPEKIGIVGDVRENSWGKRVVMLKDPDGHLIEVAEA